MDGIKVERDSRFEACRIFSMCAIVLSHYAWHGGVYFNGNDLNHAIGSFFAVGGKLGVDLFIMISAWFTVDKSAMAMSENRSVKRLIVKTTVFSLLFFSMSFLKVGNQGGLSALIRAMFGVIYGYWFVLVYISMMLLAPYINMMIYSMDKARSRMLCITSYVLISILPLIFGRKVTGELGAFIMLYLLTAYCKRYVKFKKKICIIICICSLSFLVGGDLLIKMLSPGCAGCLLDDSGDALMIILSISIFGLFQTLDPIKGRSINRLSPSMITVYLFHENEYIRKILWGMIDCKDFYASPFMFLHAIGCTIMILVIGMILDHVYTSFANVLKRISCKG